MADEWLPEGPIYLHNAADPPVRPERPWNQGDVFADVPILLLKKQKSQPVDPAELVKVHSDFVAMIGNPCSMRGGGKPAILQNVAHVRRAKEGELGRFAAK